MGEDEIESIKARQSLAVDKLETAEKLIELSKYRDSVSRSYYAMFYIAMALLITKKETPKSHQGVLNLLSRHFIMGGDVDRSFSKMLTHVMKMRQDADYEPAIEITKGDAEEALEKAKQFVAEINKKIEEYI